MFGSMAPVLIGLFLGGFTNMPWGIFVGALGMEVFTYGLNAFGIDSSIQDYRYRCCTGTDHGLY